MAYQIFQLSIFPQAGCSSPTQKNETHQKNMFLCFYSSNIQFGGKLSEPFPNAPNAPTRPSDQQILSAERLMRSDDDEHCKERTQESVPWRSDASPR